METQLVMPVLQEPPCSTRFQIIEVLASLRKDLESTSQSGSLLEESGLIGLVFADIAERMNLTQEEQFVLLGRKLYNELQAFLDTPI